MPPKNRSIEAFAVYNLKNERLPEDIPGLKLQPGQLRELLENLPAVMTDPGAIEVDCQQSIDQFLGETTFHLNVGVTDNVQIAIDYNEGVKGINETPYLLEQPTEAHKRSFVIDHPDFVNQWQDEYGNRYGVVTLKGNNFSNPMIIEHPNASTGYIPYGQQESYVIERVLKASDVMRSAGISTEYIVGLSLPKQLPWPVLRARDAEGDWQPALHEGHVMVGLDEYKRRLVNDRWMSLPESERTVESLMDLTEKFKEMMFYTTARAMDTEYRVLDMANYGMTKKVFEVFNLHYAKDFGVPELNPYKTEDVDIYFEQFLMPRLGANFAKLHTMGLAHGFANSMNLSAFGSIVDLDSVHGEALGLGDEPVTGRHKVADIVNTVSGVWQVCQNVRLHGREVDPNDMPKNSMMQFMIQYFNETIKRFDDKEEARKYLADLMMELEWLKLDTDYMAGQLKPFMQESAIACYFVFFHDVDMLKVKDEISDLISETIDRFNSEKRRSITKQLLKLVQEQKQEIMFMLQSDIAKQYMMGEDFDVITPLFVSMAPGAQLMKGELLEQIAKSLLKKTIGQAYKNKVHELNLSDEREISILWQFVQSVQQSRIFDAIGKVDEVAVRYSLVDLYMGDGKTLGYKVADSVLKERLRGNKTSTGVYGAQKGVSFAENELWVFSQGVPFYDIDDLVKDDIQVKIDYIRDAEGDDRIVRDGEALVVTVASEEGYHITQIVTDGKLLQMLADVNKPGQVELAFRDDDRPVYVLTVEEDSQGNKRVTKLIDAERFNEAAEYLFGLADLDRVENEELFSINDL